MSSEANNALLPLDQQRTFQVNYLNHRYSLTFDRISQADWQRFFAGMHVAASNTKQGKSISNSRDFQLIELATTKLSRVEGYSGDLMSKPDWKNRVHPALLRAAAEKLVEVRISESAGDRPLDPDSIDIVLDAAWGLHTFKGLVHRFTPPTVDHKRAYLNAKSQSVIVGGSRDSTTLYANSSGTVLKIYDELIQSVDGYGVTIAGPEAVQFRMRQLTDRAQIVEHMDAYHKFEAALWLFEGGAPAGEAQVEEAA